MLLYVLLLSMSKDLEEYDTCIARPISPTSWMLTRDIDYNNLNCWGWWPEVERMRRKKQIQIARVDSLQKKPPKKKTQVLAQNPTSNIINTARSNVTIRKQKTIQQPQQKHQYFKK